MVVVIFQAGEGRFGLDVGPLLEIVPMVRLEAVPRAPACVAGTFNYRGRVAPVIDVPRLLFDRPCRPLLSARIMLAAWGVAGSRVLGLMAEGVTEVRRVDDATIRRAPVVPGEARYLGEVALDGRGVLQLLNLDALLPDGLKRILLADEEGSVRT